MDDILDILLGVAAIVIDVITIVVDMITKAILKDKIVN